MVVLQRATRLLEYTVSNARIEPIFHNHVDRAVQVCFDLIADIDEIAKAAADSPL